MEKITLIMVCVIMFASCGLRGPDYKYQYTAIVTYSDSSIDTMNFNRTSFNGNPVGVFYQKRVV